MSRVSLSSPVTNLQANHSDQNSPSDLPHPKEGLSELINEAITVRLHKTNTRIQTDIFLTVLQDKKSPTDEDRKRMVRLTRQLDRLSTEIQSIDNKLAIIDPNPEKELPYSMDQNALDLIRHIQKHPPSAGEVNLAVAALQKTLNELKLSNTQ